MLAASSASGPYELGAPYLASNAFTNLAAAGTLRVSGTLARCSEGPRPRYFTTMVLICSNAIPFT
jgi:hypothetical protein